MGALVCLIGLGIALGRRAGVWLSSLCLGVLLPVVHGLGEVPVGSLAAGMPAEIVGVVEGHWRLGEESQTAPLRASRIRQRNTVFVQPLTVWVSLPSAVRAPAVGTALRIRGVLNQSSGYWNRVAVAPGPWRVWVKSEKLFVQVRHPGPLARLSGWLRGGVEAAWLELGQESPGTAMARALVLGDTSRLPERWKRGLRRWGLSHVLSVSGLHLGLVAGCVALVLFPLPRALRLICASLALVLYLLLVGPIPAMVRSAVMAWLGLAAWLLKRPPMASNSWGVALLGMLLADPSLAADLGFQLTISATAGLIFLAPLLSLAWTALPALGRNTLACTVAAQLATLPWALPRFHLLTPMAPFANWVGVPWCALVLFVDLAWVVLLVVAPPIARATVPLLDLMVRPLSWTCDLSPQWAWPLPFEGPPWVGWAIALAAGGLLLRPRSWSLALGAMIVIAVGVWPNSKVQSEMLVLDVGQGDAILLRHGRRAVLIDGGGWSRGDFSGAVLLPALVAEGVRRLDGVILSHSDSDHCGGLVGLLDLLPVHEVWAAANAGREPCGAELLRMAGSRRRLAEAGAVLELGQLRLRVLHPEAGSTKTGNDASVVLRVEGGSRTALLTGDIEAQAERILIRDQPSHLSAEILKVAHHGSRSSSVGSFLQQVRPRWAVISVGRANRYAHPAAEIVRRIEASGAMILRTDQHGAIRLNLSHPNARQISVHGKME